MQVVEQLARVVFVLHMQVVELERPGEIQAGVHARLHALLSFARQVEHKGAALFLVCVDLGQTEGAVELHEVRVRDLVPLPSELRVALALFRLGADRSRLIRLPLVLLLAAHQKSFSFAVAHEVGDLLHQPLEELVVAIVFGEARMVIVRVRYYGSIGTEYQSRGHVRGQHEGKLRQKLQSRREGPAGALHDADVLRGDLEEDRLRLLRPEQAQTDGLVQEVVRLLAAVAEFEVVHRAGDVQLRLKWVVDLEGIFDGVIEFGTRL